MFYEKVSHQDYQYVQHTSKQSSLAPDAIRRLYAVAKEAMAGVDPDCGFSQEQIMQQIEL